MINLEKNNINLLIDFDSTIIQTETIEEIANIALKKNPDREHILKKISDLTNKAMNGEIDFPEALEKRLELLNSNRKHIKETTNLLKNKLSLSIKKNEDFIKSISNRCFIISGGFKEVIYPIVKQFNVKHENVYANEFIYQNDNIVSINKTNKLSNNLGKALIAKNILGNNIIIGDGYTDYEVKKEKAAIKFIQYAENINRKKLNKHADIIAFNFNEIIDFINNLTL